MCRPANVRVAEAARTFAKPSASQPQQPQLPPLPSAWASQLEVDPDMPVIGSGAFGTIFQVRDRRTTQPFAVKVMQRYEYEIRGIGAQLATEVETMRRASGMSEPGWSRVVHLYAAAEEAGCVFLLLELCIYGTLRHQLASTPTGIPEATVARNFRHLCHALKDIHAAGVIHRDIKLDNLLITTNGVLKVTDFGWAAECKDAPVGLAGTFETMAPELLRNQPQTTAADMWSAGAVLFHGVCGRPLLPGATQENTLEKISACCPLPASARPERVSEACWDLLRSLLDVDAARRPTAAEALEHCWLFGQNGTNATQGAVKASATASIGKSTRAGGA